jgi:hypothetical protein
MLHSEKLSGGGKKPSPTCRPAAAGALTKLDSASFIDSQRVT